MAYTCLLRVRLKIIGNLETMHDSYLHTLLKISLPTIFKRTVARLPLTSLLYYKFARSLGSHSAGGRVRVARSIVGLNSTRAAARSPTRSGFARRGRMRADPTRSKATDGDPQPYCLNTMTAIWIGLGRPVWSWPCKRARGL